MKKLVIHTVLLIIIFILLENSDQFITVSNFEKILSWSIFFIFIGPVVLLPLFLCGLNFDLVPRGFFYQELFKQFYIFLSGRNKPDAGFVYNSRNFQPIAFGIIKIFNQKNKLLSLVLSDINGNFFHPAFKEKIYYQVNTAGYQFPSLLIKSKGLPLNFQYQQELIKKQTNNCVLIPLDEKATTNLFFKEKISLICQEILKFFIKINPLYLLIQTILTLIIPSNINLSLLIIFTLINLKNILLSKNLLICLPSTKKNSSPVRIIILNNLNQDKVFLIRFINKQKLYKLALPPGDYEISVLEKGTLPGQKNRLLEKEFNLQNHPLTLSL